ncbi:MAG: lysophospholipid acyltransferase family protein [Sulfurovaceae bacterium]|nr:lysophospholipid acyltransferase family protein [Sulfurovaceae bacterium]
MREKIEYFAVKFLLWCASWMPKSWVYSITKAIAMILYYILPKRRSLVYINLKNSFPNLGQDQIDKYTKEVYDSLSQSIAEILLMFVNRFDIDKAIINLHESINKINEINEQKKGVILFTAHFSNWELLAHFLAKHGLSFVVVGREGDNKIIDKNITIPFRNKYGNRAIYKNKAMISMAKAIKNKEAVGMLIDQKTGGTHSAKIEFFGHKASTTLSTAALKLKFDPLVIPTSLVRESKGRYRMYFDQPLEYIANEIDDEKEKIKAMTLRYNQALERMILRAPGQWFWMHNRWKY